MEEKQQKVTLDVSQPEDALKLLDTLVQKMQFGREEHIQIITAVQTLSSVIQAKNIDKLAPVDE